MTGLNFATSSTRAAANIVLTLSTSCLSSAARRFSWAPAAETCAEKISARAKVNNQIRRPDDMGQASCLAHDDRHPGVLFILYALTFPAPEIYSVGIKK